MPRTVKVAVVGSGLAGLTAAHLLTKPLAKEGEDVLFEVHVFEKSSTIGMDSSSISLPTPEISEKWRVDVPMRSFQGGYYTQLIELYKSLGVQFREADFSYSFSSFLPARPSQDRSVTTTFIYNGASGRAGLSRPSQFNHPSVSTKNSTIRFIWNLWTSFLFSIFILQTTFCFLITLYHSLPFSFWRQRNLENIIFRDWVRQVAPRGLVAKLTGMDVAWDNYVQTVLIPIFSAVCTSPSADIMDHPIEEFLDYIWLTFGTHHYIVIGGVCSVVAHLTSGLRHVHLSATILSIKPDTLDSKCTTITSISNGLVEEHSGFRHVVFATQAPAAAALLKTYSNSLHDNLQHRKNKIDDLVQCLETFESRPSLVINHTDDTLLPDDDCDIRELNLISLSQDIEKSSDSKPSGVQTLHVTPDYTMATQILRRPRGYPSSRPIVFQSTNPIFPPRKDAILSVAKLERAVVTMSSKKALTGLCVEESKEWWQCPYHAKTRLGDLQGARPPSELDAPGIWICGSYAHLGIPLLEGCVISARNVVQQGILEGEGVGWEEEPWIIR